MASSDRPSRSERINPRRDRPEVADPVASRTGAYAAMTVHGDDETRWKAMQAVTLEHQTGRVDDAGVREIILCLGLDALKGDRRSGLPGNPRDVECPSCHAPAGRGCHTERLDPATKTHTSRVRRFEAVRRAAA